VSVEPESLDSLEEERDFLLRSLDDLEREREAGDIDDTDYRALKDDYTARAAAVLKALDDGRATVAAPPARSPVWKVVAIVAAVAVFAGLAGLLVARSSGSRAPGQTVTGGAPLTVSQQVQAAVAKAGKGDVLEGVQALDKILATHPDNAEALTYKGWILYQAGKQGDSAELRTAGYGTLAQAVKADPEFADTHVFLAVVLRDQGLPQDALRELDTYVKLNGGKSNPLADSLRKELESPPTSTTATTAAP
jgi:tetratricopeptide (TPR) repeat protein